MLENIMLVCFFTFLVPWFGVNNNNNHAEILNAWIPVLSLKPNNVLVFQLRAWFLFLMHIEKLAGDNKVMKGKIA